jgi:outer membrane lipoprotein-sorting protein
MSYFVDHPRARWAAPAAAVVAIGGVALVAGQSANAEPNLPHRTAAQLLVDVQQAKLSAISGTVVQTSNLGLPEIPGLSGGGGGPGGGSSSLSSAITGTHTWRVWYAGPQQARIAMLGGMGESDVIRNGRNVWVWSSADKSATHTTLPADAEKASPRPTPTDLPKTPQQAADMALKALNPTTSVTTAGAAVVAGRNAYELVLRPRDSGTLVAQVRIAVDAKRHVPLRVQVYSTKAANPAFEVGFTSVDFAKPDASRFAFNPPPGTKVSESSVKPGAPGARQHDGAPGAAKDVRVVGKGWASVLVATMSEDGAAAPGATAKGGTTSKQLEGIVAMLPKVSGAWGSGHLLRGTLFSVLVTDDGHVVVGAVQPDRLYAALAAK